MATDVVEVLEDAIAMDEIQSAAEAFAGKKQSSLYLRYNLKITERSSETKQC